MPTNDLVVDRQYLQHLMERMQGEYVATSFIRQSATAVSLPKSGTRTQYQYNLGYSVIRVHREPKYGRAYIADDERFLYVSGFWLLGFGAVKMSRLRELQSGTCTMRDIAVLRDFHELYFDYQIRVRICVSFITALHPLTDRVLALVKAQFTPVCVGFEFPLGLLHLLNC